jgi:ubiquinol-cytochrome c reductase cytochrome c1 subunit
MRKLALAASAALLLAAGCGAAKAAEVSEKWSFYGIFGTYDRAAAQRGFQVYSDVCAACHPVTQLYYRDLEGIGFSEDEVKAIAAQKEVTDGPNDNGEMFKRPARPSDHIVRPFENEKQARAANNGALPPDLSLIVKAREGGPNHVYAILTSYKDPPPDVKLGQGMNYNTAFPGDQIAMPPPLAEGAVTYADGTNATIPQMAHDVATFLAWAAEPNLEERHRMGLKVMIFLVVATVLFYGAKRKIWAAIH